MTSLSDKGGMITGKSHAQGGEHFVVEETNQRIEAEGGEPVIPNEAFSHTTQKTLQGTNTDIINSINKSIGAKSLSEKADVLSPGDAIICKKAPKDKTKKTIKGTNRQIVSAINVEAGCNEIETGATITDNSGTQQYNEGGKVIEGEGLAHILLKVASRNYENMIDKLQDMNVNHRRESENIIKVYTDPTSGWHGNSKAQYKLMHDIWVDKFIEKDYAKGGKIDADADNIVAEQIKKLELKETDINTAKSRGELRIIKKFLITTPNRVLFAMYPDKVGNYPLVPDIPYRIINVKSIVWNNVLSYIIVAETKNNVTTNFTIPDRHNLYRFFRGLIVVLNKREHTMGLGTDKNLRQLPVAIQLEPIVGDIFLKSELDEEDKIPMWQRRIQYGWKGAEGGEVAQIDSLNNRLIVNGEDVGLFEYAQKGDIIEIERLYIDKDKQRKGYGSLAIDYIFRSYPQINIIEVYAGGHSPPFWLRQGVFNVKNDGAFQISREFYYNPDIRFDEGGIIDEDSDNKVAEQIQENSEKIAQGKDWDELGEFRLIRENLITNPHRILNVRHKDKIGNYMKTNIPYRIVNVKQDGEGGYTIITNPLLNWNTKKWSNLITFFHITSRPEIKYFINGQLVVKERREHSIGDKEGKKLEKSVAITLNPPEKDTISTAKLNEDKVPMWQRRIQYGWKGAEGGEVERMSEYFNYWSDEKLADYIRRIDAITYKGYTQEYMDSELALIKKNLTTKPNRIVEVEVSEVNKSGAGESTAISKYFIVDVKLRGTLSEPFYTLVISKQDKVVKGDDSPYRKIILDRPNIAYFYEGLPVVLNSYLKEDSGWNEVQVSLLPQSKKKSSTEDSDKIPMWQRRRKYGWKGADGGEVMSGKSLKKFLSTAQFKDESFFDNIKNKDKYELQDIDVNKIIQSDATLSDFINYEDEYDKVISNWVEREYDYPIIIGDSKWEKGIVLDGYHRIKFAKTNRDNFIVGYVKQSEKFEKGGRLHLLKSLQSQLWNNNRRIGDKEYNEIVRELNLPEMFAEGGQINIRKDDFSHLTPTQQMAKMVYFMTTLNNINERFKSVSSIQDKIKLKNITILNTEGEEQQIKKVEFNGIAIGYLYESVSKNETLYSFVSKPEQIGRKAFNFRTMSEFKYWISILFSKFVGLI